MKKLPRLLMLLAVAFPGAVQAQTDWAYYGLSIGKFDYSESVVLGQDPFVDSADSWRLMIGYQFMEHLAVEGGYGKPGKIRDTATFSSPFAPGSVELGLETEISRILTIRLLGTLPFDNGLLLLGGLGYADYKQDGVFSVNGVPQFSRDFGDNRPAYYLGVQYNWDRVALRLGYEKFDFNGEIDAEEVAVTFFYKI